MTEDKEQMPKNGEGKTKMTKVEEVEQKDKIEKEKIKAKKSESSAVTSESQ